MRKFLLLVFSLTVAISGLSNTFNWMSDGYHVRIGDRVFVEAFHGNWGVGVEFSKSGEIRQRIGILQLKVAEGQVRPSVSVGNGVHVGFQLEYRDIVPFPGSFRYTFMAGPKGGYVVSEHKYNAKLAGFGLSFDNFAYLSNDKVVFWDGAVAYSGLNVGYKLTSDAGLIGFTNEESRYFLGIGLVRGKLGGGIGVNFKVNEANVKLLFAATERDHTYGASVEYQGEKGRFRIVANKESFYISLRF